MVQDLQTSGTATGLQLGLLCTQRGCCRAAVCRVGWLRSLGKMNSRLVLEADSSITACVWWLCRPIMLSASSYCTGSCFIMTETLACFQPAHLWDRPVQIAILAYWHLPLVVSISDVPHFAWPLTMRGKVLNTGYNWSAWFALLSILPLCFRVLLCQWQRWCPPQLHQDHHDAEQQA